MFEVDNTMSYKTPPLINNDFKELNSEIDGVHYFVNNNCTVEVDLNNQCYNIIYKDISYIKNLEYLKETTIAVNYIY